MCVCLWFLSRQDISFRQAGELIRGFPADKITFPIGTVQEAHDRDGKGGPCPLMGSMHTALKGWAHKSPWLQIATALTGMDFAINSLPRMGAMAAFAASGIIFHNYLFLFRAAAKVTLTQTRAGWLFLNSWKTSSANTNHATWKPRPAWRLLFYKCCLTLESNWRGWVSRKRPLGSVTWKQEYCNDTNGSETQEALNNVLQLETEVQGGRVQETSLGIPPFDQHVIHPKKPVFLKTLGREPMSDGFPFIPRCILFLIY